MAGGNKVFILVKKDTVVQLREYVVLAESEEQAQQRVDNGLFVTESDAETIDTIESETSSITEIT